MEARFTRKVDSQLLRLDTFTHTRIHASRYTRCVRALSLACKFVYPDAIIVIPYLAVSCGTLAFAACCADRDFNPPSLLKLDVLCLIVSDQDSSREEYLL